MKRTTISLPDDVAEELEMLSRRRRETLSETVRDVLKRGLESSRGRDFSIIGIVSDGRPPHAAEIDDYLARHWPADIERGRNA